MEDVIAESIQVMGHNVYYIPRESFDEGDMILGEYSKSAFNKAYLVEAYIANVEGFEGQNDLFSKFGLEIRDNSNFILSRRAFIRTIPGSIRQRPQEGDLVYVPVFHRMFEIKFVEHELMMHSIGKRLPYVYEMRCEMFRSSNEPINTGVEEVDQVGIDNGYTLALTLTQIGGYEIDYFLGEEVFQSANGNWNGAYAHGSVTQWFASNNTIQIHNIVGQFQVGQTLIGNTSNATYTVSYYDEKVNNSFYDLFDNKPLETESTPFLDLSESNPFGTP